MTDLRAARGSDHDENKRIAALEDRLNANQDERDRMSADIEAFKINAADYKKEAAHAQVSLFGYLVIWLFGYLVIWLFGN
jgi:molecular chaperone GrpE (heat shock protein)